MCIELCCKEYLKPQLRGPACVMMRQLLKMATWCIGGTFTHASKLTLSGLRPQGILCLAKGFGFYGKLEADSRFSLICM